MSIAIVYLCIDKDHIVLFLNATIEVEAPRDIYCFPSSVLVQLHTQIQV